MMRTMSLEAYFDDQMPETLGEARPELRRRSKLAHLRALARVVTRRHGPRRSPARTA